MAARDRKWRKGAEIGVSTLVVLAMIVVVLGALGVISTPSSKEATRNAVRNELAHFVGTVVDPHCEGGGGEYQRDEFYHFSEFIIDVQSTGSALRADADHPTAGDVTVEASECDTVVICALGSDGFGCDDGGRLPGGDVSMSIYARPSSNTVFIDPESNYEPPTAGELLEETWSLTLQSVEVKENKHSDWTTASDPKVTVTADGESEQTSTCWDCIPEAVFNKEMWSEREGNAYTTLEVNVVDYDHTGSDQIGTCEFTVPEDDFAYAESFGFRGECDAFVAAFTIAPSGDWENGG